MQILDLLGMYFDAVIVFVKKNSFLFLSILCLINNITYLEFHFTRGTFKFNTSMFEIIMGFHQKGGLENLPTTRNRTRIFFPLVNGCYVGSQIFLHVEILATE
jgi:hypothetical protein